MIESLTIERSELDVVLQNLFQTTLDTESNQSDQSIFLKEVSSSFQEHNNAMEFKPVKYKPILEVCRLVEENTAWKQCSILYWISVELTSLEIHPRYFKTIY